eukprot:1158443-Pelagomonas_calceolata.AAC.28
MDQVQSHRGWLPALLVPLVERCRPLKVVSCAAGFSSHEDCTVQSKRSSELLALAIVNLR